MKFLVVNQQPPGDETPQVFPSETKKISLNSQTERDKIDHTPENKTPRLITVHSKENEIKENEEKKSETNEVRISINES